MATYTTRMRIHIDAPRAAVYRALIDGAAVEAWRVPDGMSSQVHEFDGREGGRFRVSLTYREPRGVGKSSAHTDTYHGTFATLVPNERVVEEITFETDDPAMQGTMTVEYVLQDADGGTDVLAEHRGVPAAIPPADNDLGWRMSLGKLKRWIEERPANANA